MISQTAEYALRAVVWLASRTEKLVSTADIARATQVPAGYLSKTLQILARAGIVESTPGRTGGFKLGRSPKELSVLDVINAVDPLQRIHECPLKLKAHAHALCPLHRRLDDAARSVEQAFASSSIAEMLATPNGLQPLCPANEPAERSKS